jgi:predicted glycosyltransferase
MRKRIFIYVQGLSGTGHFVRMFEVARALAPHHDVLLLDGGRTVPRPPAPVERFGLPRICRGPDGEVAAADPRQPIGDVLRTRRDLLEQAIRRLRPDILLIEDFPFSKWEMAREILDTIRWARESNERLRVVCSLRDIGTRNRRRIDIADHPGRVRRTLSEHFDLAVVHADPNIVRIEEHLPWATAIEVPIRYTGFVSQKVAGTKKPDGERFRVVVATGGAASTLLVPLAVRAWRHVTEATSGRSSHGLIVFLPADASDEELAHARGEIADPTIEIRPFSAEFLECLSSADVSVSHAGYNTCTNIMETRTPAVLLPNPCLSDQPLRARLLARLGLAEVLDLSVTEPAQLAAAIRRQNERDIPHLRVDLSGAERTRLILEQL